MDLSANGWWVAVPADVVRCPGLSVMARLLHVILMSYRNPQKPDEPVFPRADTLAKMLDVCEKTVSRAMKELLDAKIIERKRRMGRSTLTLLKATGFVLPTGHPVPSVPDSHVPAEEEPGKKSHTPSADKPRGVSSDNPTETEAPRERIIVPAEETVPYRPLARQSRKPPDPKYHSIGARARRLWAQIVVPAAPPLATWSPATLVKAGKTVAGLKDTPFAGKTLEELMPILVARIKSCNPLVRKSVNFGWLFCADAPNLARILAGDWDTGAGEVQEPKRRAIPADDYWPGMDEEEYWREKDGEVNNG